jgi:superfamily I DNA/RNA helicase/CRISPR/Cas system-associated exonuclease Cas4 (RecB family)
MHSSKRSDYIEIIRHPLEHMRVLGPAGSGKTTLLLERYRHLCAQGNAGMDGIAILTYTKESAQSLTSELLPEMSALRGREPVYRYYDLARDVLNAAGVGQRTIGQMEELVLLDRIVSRMSGEGRGGFASGPRSDKFQRLLLNLIRALLQNGVSAGQVRELCNAPELAGRLAGVSDIYEQFCGELRRERLTTDYDICRRAVEALQKEPSVNPLKDIRVLLIDDFQDVDTGQYALLCRLAPPNGAIRLNVFGDPTAAHFRFKGTQHRFLMDLFPRHYPCSTFHLCARSAGASHLGGAIASLLEATLGEDAECYLPVALLQGAQDAGDGLPGRAAEFAVSFDVRPDEFNEVLRVAEQVKALLADRYYRPHDIAIAAREKHRYEILLSSAFQYFGIPLESGRHRRDVVENFIVDLLLLLCSPHDEAAAASLVASPFYRTVVALFAPPAEITGGRSEDVDEAGKLNSLLNALRKKLFAKPAADFVASLLTEAVLPAVRDGEAEATNPYHYAYLSRLLAEWGRYTTATGRPAHKTEAELVRGFMNKCGIFDDSFAPFAPVPGRVGFYSCHELKERTFPVVFLVGCSEMLFPTAKVEEGVIPYDFFQRACDGRFPEHGVEFFPARSTESHLRDEYSLLLLALTRASHKLFISAPLRVGGEVETGPTSIIYDALPDEIRPQAASRNEQRSMVPPVARWAEHLVRVEGEVAALLGERLRKRVPGLSPVPLLWHAKPPADRALETPRRRISQSSLRTFDTCPRRYFYAKVLSVPEEDSLAMRFGALFHEVMKELAEAFPAQERMHGARAKERAGAIIDEVMRRRADQVESPLVERSMRHYLARMLEQFFEVDERRSDNYTICMVESPLRFTYGDVDFVGVVDRLDSSQSGRQVVIDYKTGKIKKTGAGIRKNILDSAAKPDERDWQVPIYAYGVLSGGATTPLAFSYYNIQAGEEPFVVSLFIDDEGRGADPESLFAGGLKKRFGALDTNEVNSCMEDAARLAQTIFAPTRFFARTEDENHCRYCSYRFVCRRGEAWN